ncbi:hypothetical protein [Stakelama tenebrarum]|uniref:Uncharacterized protein n=1 Tax=Stakelama tenebrarum TaxID=2711215 RepID=A0A6G6Y5L3_9SPHN|nr:hypothetical protein [Sphingosinithalassobacter tenebrarum]QIG80189.1 hypothetical protein G5C33_10630 [Sphingosinithalassobacter tenebrarum]
MGRLKMPLSLSDIRNVTFYKRIDPQAELLCCEVEMRGRRYFFHERSQIWSRLIRQLETLPGFRRDWRALLAKARGAGRRMVAFERSA